ncbi:Alpha/Beta hydrolase protein [Mycena filopes]|nr:Alpha/Beta hydrolase protein [Mycena filopes]
MAAPISSDYGQLRWSETLGMVASLIPLPAVLFWNVATTASASFNKNRSLKRIFGDSLLRYLVTNLSVPQLQYAFGTTLQVYRAWLKNRKLPATIDELGEDARLLWIGPKRLDRVVMFCHGGGFLLPAVDCSLSFWRHVQLELEKQDIEIGLILFNYSLAPRAPFPTPLKQAGLALEFLMAAGVQPQNLQLVGDSAGGNLILQILLHMLHPRSGVPEIRLPAPLRGACLISPWTNLSVDSKSHDENQGRDFLEKAAIADWGAQVLAGVPEADRAFVETVRAEEGLFNGVEALVERVLVTGGGAELLRDDIVAFAEVFEKHHSRTELVIQENGVHEDMYLDFFVGEKNVCILTPLVIDWLAVGFRA